MKSYSSREVLKILKADGWYEGCVTVTHPRKDIPYETLKSISQQAGITFP